jgi:hypothetical protein
VGALYPRQGGRPPSPPDLQEVMALGEALEPNLEELDWRIPILEWMVEGKRPTDSAEAQHIARRAKSFRLINEDLYHQGAAGILMHCILADQGRQLLQDIHAGDCGHHTPPKQLLAALSGKVSTGPQQSLMPRSLYEDVKVASSTLDKRTSRRRHSNPFPTPGPSLCGGSIW